jgi:hypothetical protein
MFVHCSSPLNHKSNSWNDCGQKTSRSSGRVTGKREKTPVAGSRKRHDGPDSGFRLPRHDDEIRSMAPIVTRHLPALPESGRTLYFQP